MARSPKSRPRKSNGGTNGKSSYGVVGDILALAGSLTNSRRDYAAGKLEMLAESVREYSNSLPRIPNLNAYAHEAANRLEGLANYIVDSDIETMASDAQVFVRRHPVATLAGSIAAGIIVTQMLHGRSVGSRRVAKAPSGSRRSNGQRSRATA